MVHVPVGRSSQGHAWGSPRLGAARGCSFDAGASATTRADTQHLVHDAPRPLRRGRPSCMPTALGSVIWELRQEASSRPGQGVAGRGEGSAPRTEGFMREKNPPSVSKVNIAPIDLRATRPRRPRNAAPAALNSFYSQRQAPLKRPRRGRSTTKPHSSEAAPRAQR